LYFLISPAPHPTRATPWPRMGRLFCGERACEGRATLRCRDRGTCNTHPPAEQKAQVSPHPRADLPTKDPSAVGGGGGSGGGVSFAARRVRLHEAEEKAKKNKCQNEREGEAKIGAAKTRQN